MPYGEGQQPKIDRFELDRNGITDNVLSHSMTLGFWVPMTGIKADLVPKARRRRGLDVLLTAMQAVIGMAAAIASNITLLRTGRASKAVLGITALAFVFVALAISAGVGYFRERATQVSTLKNTLVGAFWDALDASDWNPSLKK